jgi:hypothetical protein
MAKPTIAVLFRLTPDQHDVLEALAYLERVTSNEFARQLVVAAINQAKDQPRVQTVQKARAEQDAEKDGTLTRLRLPRRSD